MAKNNRKKAVAEAISTAIALGLVIMQVESAQAATLTVNNLNDSGVGSLRDTINMATSNDVVDFLLGSHPSTIALTSGAIAIAKNLTINGPGANLLTISGNNQFPVFDISAANVTLSGLAIAGNFNAYNFSNLKFTNSTISGDNLKIDINGDNLTFINSTIRGNNSVNITTNALSLTDGSQIGNLSKTTNSGDLTISIPTLIIPNSTSSNSGQISAGLGGNITLTSPDLLLRRVPKPSAIAGGNINSGAAGSITVTAGSITLTASDVVFMTTVPEPSAIAGSILAVSLAWLAKKKQAAFSKAKV
ncbi:hypothetical protein [Nostoc sp.]|uniref:hypothetical protein n=1 Tax=Nostoc sp. TaxID=1180 RepID=UPI002FFD1337